MPEAGFFIFRFPDAEYLKHTKLFIPFEMQILFLTVFDYDRPDEESKMKKLIALVALIALVGCAEKKPLTPEEQWHGYCKSVGNAARTIMLDRQNAITKDQAVEHANKIDDDTTKTFILDIIEHVYALPESSINTDIDGIREKVRSEYTAKCIATPHDEMPDYKPF